MANKPQEPETKLARHAETAEDAAKRQAQQAEDAGKVPAPGSRDYVAGQPVNEEERAETEADAERLTKHGEEQRKHAEEQRRRHEEEVAKAGEPQTQHKPAGDRKT